MKRVLLRETQVAPVILVFEDLHWIDAETQAFLDGLVPSLGTARVPAPSISELIAPEYVHGWTNLRN